MGNLKLTSLIWITALDCVFLYNQETAIKQIRIKFRKNTDIISKVPFKSSYKVSVAAHFEAITPS